MKTPPCQTLILTPMVTPGQVQVLLWFLLLRFMSSSCSASILWLWEQGTPLELLAPGREWRMEAIRRCSRSHRARNRCRKLTWSDSTEMSQLEVPRARGSGASAHYATDEWPLTLRGGAPAAPRRDGRPMAARGTRSMLYPRRPIIRCMIVTFVGSERMSTSRGPAITSPGIHLNRGPRIKIQEIPEVAPSDFARRTGVEEPPAANCDGVSVLGAHMAKISAQVGTLVSASRANSRH